MIILSPKSYFIVDSKYFILPLNNLQCLTGQSVRHSDEKIATALQIARGASFTGNL
jgi:hypothetical protein